jgi:hypothetical protein
MNIAELNFLVFGSSSEDFYGLFLIVGKMSLLPGKEVHKFLAIDYNDKESKMAHFGGSFQCHSAFINQ